MRHPSQRLGSVARIEHGWPFASAHWTAPEVGDRPKRVVAIGNFADRGGLVAEFKGYSGEYPKSHELVPGDVLFVMTCQTADGEILGLPGIVPDDGATYLHNQRTGKLVIRDPELVDSRFIYYVALTTEFNRQLYVTATGTKILHTSPRRMEDAIVPLPPLQEQRAIAEVLGALDDKIAANAATTDAAEELAIMLASRSAQRVELDELAALRRVARMPHSAPGELVLHYSLPAYDDTRLPMKEAAAGIKSAKFHLTSECVLVSKLNPRIPRVWLADGLTGLEAWASTEFMPLQSKSVSPRVLWSVLAHPGFAGSLAAMVAGTSGSHQRVRPDDMLTTEVLDPRELDAQTLSRIDGLVEMATRSRIQSRTLAQLRDALLPHLMSGKLRVRDAERQVEEAV